VIKLSIKDDAMRMPPELSKLVDATHGGTYLLRMAEVEFTADGEAVFTQKYNLHENDENLNPSPIVLVIEKKIRENPITVEIYVRRANLIGYDSNDSPRFGTPYFTQITHTIPAYSDFDKTWYLELNNVIEVVSIIASGGKRGDKFAIYGLADFNIKLLYTTGVDDVKDAIYEAFDQRFAGFKLCNYCFATGTDPHTGGVCNTCSGNGQTWELSAKRYGLDRLGLDSGIVRWAAQKFEAYDTKLEKDIKDIAFRHRVHGQRMWIVPRVPDIKSVFAKFLDKSVDDIIIYENEGYTHDARVFDLERLYENINFEIPSFYYNYIDCRLTASGYIEVLENLHETFINLDNWNVGNYGGTPTARITLHTTPGWPTQGNTSCMLGWIWDSNDPNNYISRLTSLLNVRYITYDAKTYFRCNNTNQSGIFAGIIDGVVRRRAHHLSEIVGRLDPWISESYSGSYFIDYNSQSLTLQPTDISVVNYPKGRLYSSGPCDLNDGFGKRTYAFSSIEEVPTILTAGEELLITAACWNSLFYGSLQVSDLLRGLSSVIKISPDIRYIDDGICEFHFYLSEEREWSKRTSATLMFNYFQNNIIPGDHITVYVYAVGYSETFEIPQSLSLSTAKIQLPSELSNENCVVRIYTAFDEPLYIRGIWIDTHYTTYPIYDSGNPDSSAIVEFDYVVPVGSSAADIKKGDLHLIYQDGIIANSFIYSTTIETFEPIPSDCWITDVITVTHENGTEEYIPGNNPNSHSWYAGETELLRTLPWTGRFFIRFRRRFYLRTNNEYHTPQLSLDRFGFLKIDNAIYNYLTIDTSSFIDDIPRDIRFNAGSADYGATFIDNIRFHGYRNRGIIETDVYEFDESILDIHWLETIGYLTDGYQNLENIIMYYRVGQSRYECENTEWIGPFTLLEDPIDAHPGEGYRFVQWRVVLIPSKWSTPQFSTVLLYLRLLKESSSPLLYHERVPYAPIWTISLATTFGVNAWWTYHTNARELIELAESIVPAGTTVRVEHYLPSEGSPPNYDITESLTITDAITLFDQIFDDFEDDTLGADPDNWNISITGTGQRGISNEQSYSGTQSYKCWSGAGGGSVTSYFIFDENNDGSFEVSGFIRRCGVTGGLFNYDGIGAGEQATLVGDPANVGASTVLMALAVGPLYQWIYQDDGGINVVPGITWTPDHWYFVRIRGNVETQLWWFQIWDAETTPHTLLHEQGNINFINTCAYIRLMGMSYIGPATSYCYFDNMNFYYLSG